MGRSENNEPEVNRPGTPMSLTDEDITTVRVDRRSVLSRAVAVGSLAAAAAVTTACPGGTDSDGEGDAGAPADSDQATDSDQQ